jgi:hypothetical protein
MRTQEQAYVREREREGAFPTAERGREGPSIFLFGQNNWLG